ncbi:hypothetical protein C4K46_06060 [Streptococcus oricebi]|uniref:TIGR04197 family type VII secretion effector n=2 Tax=Streptococcus oricebi TaxID=1547447 RepID=A0ABS5B3V8_9STRE|nr:hypothetical protein [Streptococcus oricebi]
MGGEIFLIGKPVFLRKNKEVIYLVLRVLVNHVTMIQISNYTKEVLMSTIQSNSASAQTCATSLVTAAAGINSVAAISEDKTSKYIGNDLVQGLIANEKSIGDNIASQLNQFVGLVHSVDSRFQATDQGLSQEIRKD